MTEEFQISRVEAKVIFKDLYASLMRDTQHEALGSLKEQGIKKNVSRRKLFIRLANFLEWKSRISEYEALSMGIMEWVSEKTIKKCSSSNWDNRYHFPIIEYFKRQASPSSP